MKKEKRNKTEADKIKPEEAGKIMEQRPEKKNRERQKTKENRKRKHKKAPMIIAAVIVLLVVLKLVSGMGAGQAGAVVTAVSASRGDLQDSVSTSGIVESEEVKVIFAPASGIIENVNAEAGDAVKAGELLLSYNMEEQERTLRQSELQLEKSTAGYESVYAKSAESQAEWNEANINLDVLNQQIADNEAYLQKLQEQLEKSQRDTANALAAENYNLSEKLKTLDPAGDEYSEVSSQLAKNNYLQQVASSSDYVAAMQTEIAAVEKRIADYEEYKARMETQKSAGEAGILSSYDKTQQEADKELAYLSYAETEEEYERAKAGITAEFDGIITASSAVPGAAVTRGMQLMTLESSEDVRVSFRATKYDVEKLELGQKAQVTISGNVYEGEVSKIDRMAERSESNTPMVGVEIRILNPDEDIILGMDAKLVIYTDKAENALLIPAEAINADKDGDFLYVVENGILVRKPIVCGISTEDYTEVLEGITEQDVIVLTSTADLEEGMAVTVITEATSEAPDRMQLNISVGQ